MADQDIERDSELMEGEPDSARNPGDSQYWAKSYSRVIAFEEHILAQMRELATREPEEVQAEIMKTNIKPMEDLIAAFKRRERRWRSGDLSVVPEEEPPAREN